MQAIGTYGSLAAVFQGCIVSLIILCCAPDRACAQNINAGCSDDFACRIRARAQAIIDDDPSALEKSVILLTDVISSRLSLQADISLRTKLELLRKPVFHYKDTSPVVALAVSSGGKFVAIGAEDGQVTLLDGLSFARKGGWRHDRAITALTFSQDERYVASASQDSVHVFDSNTSQNRMILKGGAVNILAFSPDNNNLRLASGGDDNQVRVFSVVGTAKPIVFSHPKAVVGVYFDRDGKSLITASNDGKITIFDSHDPSKRLRELDARDPVNCLKTSLDREWLAAGCTGRIVTVWRLHNDTPALTFLDTNKAKAVALDPDGQWMATGSYEGEVRVFKLATQEEVMHVRVHGSVKDIAISNDARWVAVASTDKTARVFEVHTGVEMARVTHLDEVNALAFSANNNLLLSASQDGSFLASPVIGRTEKQHLRQNVQISAVALNESRLRAAIATLPPVANLPPSVSLYDLYSGQWSGSLPRNATPAVVDFMVFSGHGDYLMTADRYLARVFDTSSKPTAIREVPIQDWMTAGAFTPDSKRAAVADAAGTVQVFKTQTTGKDMPIENVATPIRSVAFNQDGQFLAVASGRIAVLYKKVAVTNGDAWVPQELKPMVAAQDIVSVSFHPNSALLATGSTDKRVRVYAVADGHAIREFQYDSGVLAVMFDSRGDLFAVATNDGMIHVLETAKWEEIERINNYERQIKALQFGENDDSIWTMSTGDDLLSRYTSVRQFPVSAHSLVREACDLISYPTALEWPQYIPEEPYHDICAAGRK